MTQIKDDIKQEQDKHRAAIDDLLRSVEPESRTTLLDAIAQLENLSFQLGVLKGVEKG